MIFSRLGRSLSRSARSRFEPRAIVGGYGVRSSEVCQDVGKLGFLRGYMTSVGAGRAQEWRFLLANPSFRRFFSSESSNKKNYENYYPKGKKENPKESGSNKSESKEDSSTDGQQDYMKQLQNNLTPILLLGLLLSSFSSFGSSDQREDASLSHGVGLSINEAKAS